MKLWERAPFSPIKDLRIRADNARGGFSLVELLLTMVLVLCLAAASVFTFTAIFRSANLDEGSDRFQSLIRFAQAEAATTGRKVRLQFEASPLAEDSAVELRNIKVTWEADLLNAPGVFQDYTNKAWSEEIVNELVGVQKVQPLLQADSSPVPRIIVSSAGEGELDDPEAEMLLEEFPSITFYPDGSCDSAEIVLASRNSDDQRLLAVRLSGLLGSVTTRTYLPEYGGDMLDSELAAAEFQEYSDLFDASDPVSEFAR